MKVISVYQIPKQPFLQLPTDWDIVFPPENQTFFTQDELAPQIADCDFLVPVFTLPLTNELLAKAVKLKMIANYGAGFNNVDTRYARSKGITVCNTPASVSNPTAEHTMALMLAVSREIIKNDKKLHQQKEQTFGMMLNLGHTLEGKTLGIIGMGSIGLRVAQMASAFRMNVVYLNSKTEVPGYTKLPLAELLAVSDVISLHTPLNDTTRHLIGAQELAQMKSTAILINTARGPIVDEQALVEALQSNRIAAAGLDVFENEPHINKALYGMDNVVLTPHTGSGTIECREAISKEVCDNILNFLAGKPTNVVN